LLFKHAEKINLSVKEFNQMADNLSNNPSESIEIGVTPSLGTSFLPEYLAKFNELEPAIKFTIINSQSHELLERLHDFSHDIIICYNPPKLEQYKQTILKRGEMVFITSKDDKRFKDKTYIELKHLAKESLIKIDNDQSTLLAENNRDAFTLEGYFEQKKIKPQWIARTETFHVAKKMVEKGIAGAVIDGTTALTGDSSELHVLKIKPAIKYKIVCINNPNKPKSKSVNKLLNFLSEKKRGS